MNRCEVCLEKNCPTNHKCKCDTCKNILACTKYIRPTIRITTRCTQKCTHCCFSCSPEKTDMMTIEKAKEVAQFLRNNDIQAINLMGGEFFLNKAWYSIFKLLITHVKVARIVSNGDWVVNNTAREKFLKLNNEFGNKIKLSLSYDRWHNNINVQAAAEFCKQYNINYNVATEEQTTDMSIVPLGRAIYTDGLYSMLGCYCYNNEHMYSLLINEVGEIYKCPFGVLRYANITDYKHGGFKERFKSFNTKFYDIFIPSCARCIEYATIKGSIDKATEGR